MNEEILTNLSVIASFHNRNCSVLNAFLPIVEYGVSILFDEGHANHFDTQLLQDTIKQNTGIYINSISLKTLLKRLEKDKCITLFDRGQYFCALEKNRIVKEHFLSAQREDKRNVNALLLKYKDFSKDERSIEELNEWFYSFLKLYRRFISIDNSEIFVKKDDIVAGEYFKLLSFIKNINETDDFLSKTFIKIYFGLNLYSLLEANFTESPKLKLNDLTVYLDSNFILRLLDLQGKDFTNETNELYYSLINCGVRLVVFDETISEIRSVLKYYLEQYKEKKDSFNSLFGTPDNIDGVLGAYFRRGLSIVQIENLIDKLPEKIRQLNIQTDNIEHYNQSVKSEDIEALYNEKYAQYEEESITYRRKKVENYLKIIKIMQYKRKNIRGACSCLANCGFVFLTCDYKVLFYNKSKANMNNRYPEVISQEILANDLLFLSPQETGKISLGLMISLLNASNYLNVHILDKLSDTIAEIAQENPEMRDYLVLVTRNSEYYAQLNEIYIGDENDSKKIVIELAKNEQRNEQERERLHKDELEAKDEVLQGIISDNDRLKAEKTELSEKYSNLRNRNIDNAKNEFDHFKRKMCRKYAILEIAISAVGILMAILSVLFLQEAWAVTLGIVLGLIGIAALVIFVVQKWKSCSLDSNKQVEKKKIDISQKYGLNITDF